MIFYFSGSGGTRWAAENLGLGDEVVNLGDALRFGELEIDLTREQRVGFFVPTYFWGVPRAVREFVEKAALALPDRCYVYTVLTCGGSTGNADRMLAQLLAARGIRVRASFALKLVDNYSPMFKMDPPAKQRTIEAAAGSALAQIREAAAACRPGDFNKLRGPLPGVITPLIYRAYGETGPSTGLFAVSDACVGCGLCAGICPDGDIEMRDKKPAWVKKHCTRCLACFHHCPAAAISAGRMSLRNGRYLHPIEGRTRE
jgi:ferredoxin